MKQNIGESGLAVFLGQVKTVVDTPEICNRSMNQRMFLIILIVYFSKFNDFSNDFCAQLAFLGTLKDILICQLCGCYGNYSFINCC